MSNLEKYAVIMAGGAGSRLWPLSREKKPKQFINADGNKSMLVQTIERICEVVPAEKCFIITNRNLLDITKDTIKDLIPHSNIILEPLRKNTAACIAYASLLLKKKFGSGLLCFVPADGYVKNNADYRTALEQAYFAAETMKTMVVIGINPTFPSSGYGYIHVEEDKDIDEKILKVVCFVEKPDVETAKKFILSGKFLWNSGMVFGNMDVINADIKLFLPYHYNKISDAVSHIDEEDNNIFIEKAYNEIQDISFDIGVLEKSKCIHTVKGFFDWDDIGSLDALSKTLVPDALGNTVKGSHFGVDTSNSMIYGNDMLIATIGINNMIIATTKDAIIVCPRERAQDIKFLVEKLKLNGYENYVN